MNLDFKKILSKIDYPADWVGIRYVEEIQNSLSTNNSDVDNIKRNCSKDMIKVHQKHKSSVMASMKVNSKTVSRWGIYSLNKKISKNDYFIDGVVEKPSIKNAPSNKAVIGRYILPKTIFNKLAKQKPGNGGEIHITDAIQTLIKEGEKFIAHNFSGKYLDCGTMQGFINSNKEIGKL